MAETGVIPFAESQASGLDPLSGASPLVVNFIVDAAGALKTRPGIDLYTDWTAPVASPVIGLYTWKNILLAVTEDRSIYAQTAPGTIANLGTLPGTGKPIWTYDSERVMVSGGGAPMYWDGAALTASSLVDAAISPDGAPLIFTHIAYSAQRIIGNVNNNTGVLQWSTPGPGAHVGTASWPIVGPYYTEAEAAPDPVVAVFANTNEVFAFGTETTQVYNPDPDLGFSVSASLQVGCSAAYSVIETEEGTFAWLDNNRRFVMSSGRDLDVISSPGMAADIKTFATVSDCWGANIMIGSHDLLVWIFPTEKRGPYYNKVTKKWGEFRSIDSNADWVGWIAKSYYYWPERNIHLVGLEDGTIGTMSFESFTDNGTTIRAVSRTGFVDRGTFVRKACQRVDLQLRRGGTVPPVTAPVVELRYRDDLGAWRPAKRFSMGAAQYQPVVTAWSAGMYRQRQWELDWSGGSEFLLAGASESFVQGDV